MSPQNLITKFLMLVILESRHHAVINNHHQSSPMNQFMDYLNFYRCEIWIYNVRIRRSHPFYLIPSDFEYIMLNFFDLKKSLNIFLLFLSISISSSVPRLKEEIKWILSSIKYEKKLLSHIYLLLIHNRNFHSISYSLFFFFMPYVR